MSFGKLYLIPTLLGEQLPELVLPASVFKIVQELDHYIVENEKSARQFIKIIQPAKKQSDLVLYPMDKHTSKVESQLYLENCKKGISMGILSEAGVPAIADPGSHLVFKAHELGIQVVPLVGPSSLLLAMMSSGLNGQNFAFVGYLPVDEFDKIKKIKLLERWSAEKNQSQIFIETPFRNNKLFKSLVEHLQPNTLLCVASDITLNTEYIATKKIAQWKNEKVDFHKKPTIFIIHAS